MGFYQVAQQVVLFIMRFRYRIEVRDKHNLPSDDKGYVLASNHCTYSDPLFIGLGMKRQVFFMAKEELFKAPILSWVLPRIRVFSLKRGKNDISALKQSLRTLEEGSPLLVFPQGRRSTSAKPDKIYPGVGFLASKMNVPVLPARIYNTDKVLPPGKVLPRFKKIKVVFGKPMRFEGSRSFQEISQEVFRAINSL